MRLATMLTDLMTHLVAAYDVTGTPDAPEHRRIEHGLPAFTVQPCLWVWPVNIVPVPLGPAETCFLIPRYTVQLAVTRPWPTIDDQGSEPRPNLTEASATLLADDAESIWLHLASERQAGNLFPNLTPAPNCSDVTFSSATTLGPNSGVAGWSLGIQVDHS